MPKNKPVFFDRGKQLLCHFTKCSCTLLFDKQSLLNRKPNTCATYCKNYPDCERGFVDAYNLACDALKSEAFEAILVIPDEDIHSEMDFTGMV